VTRRQVRVTPAFFDQVDDQLPAERGPHGEPSATDFIALELPAIIERFGTTFDQLPETIEGVPTARMLIVPGVLAHAIAVFGLLTDDNAIELIGITIDPDRPDDP
jgi:hypothetical protein